MGVDPQQHRQVTGLFSSSSASRPLRRGGRVRGEGGRARREGGREALQDLWWREQVDGQRRDLLAAFLRLGGLGALWLFLLFHLSFMLPSVWKLHTVKEWITNHTSPLGLEMPAGHETYSDGPNGPGFPDVIVPIAMLLFR